MSKPLSDAWFQELLVGRLSAQVFRQYFTERIAAEREACARIAEDGAAECLKSVRPGCRKAFHCDHPECCEQRSMATACRANAAAIRARKEGE